MRAECISNTDFQGRVVIKNKFSNKPRKCVSKAKKDIENIVKNDNYILYLTQDYSTNTINFELKTYCYPNLRHEEIVNTDIVNKININSKASKYVETAKKTIADYKALQQQLWEKEQDKQSLKDMGELFASLALLPVVMFVGGIVEGTKEISKDFKNMFNKAKKLAIKKG